MFVMGLPYIDMTLCGVGVGMFVNASEKQGFFMFRVLLLGLIRSEDCMLLSPAWRYVIKSIDSGH